METKEQLLVVNVWRRLTMSGSFFLKVGVLKDAKSNLYECEEYEHDQVKTLSTVKQTRGEDGKKWIVRPLLSRSWKLDLEIDFKSNKLRLPEPHNGWDGLEDWCPFRAYRTCEEYHLDIYPYDPCP
jgi:hypothetical protein